MQHLQQDIARLLEVQERESRLLALEQEMARLPRALDETRARITGFSEEFETIRGEIRELQVKKKELDLESEEKLEAVAKYQKQQYEVKSNVEYQALQKEIAGCKAENSRIEDRILEVMEEIDGRERLIKEKETALAQKRHALAAEEKTVAEESAKLEQKIAALSLERDALLPGISPQILRKYQRIFKNKRDSAIVPLVDYTCGGCHMQLPPQIANNVRKLNELVVCESCSRILYWAEGIPKAGEVSEPLPQGTTG